MRSLLPFTPMHIAASRVGRGPNDAKKSSLGWRAVQVPYVRRSRDDLLRSGSSAGATLG